MLYYLIFSIHSIKVQSRIREGRLSKGSHCFCYREPSGTFRWHFTPSSCSYNTTTIDYTDRLFLFVVGSWNQSKLNDNCMCYSLSPVQFFATPWTVAHCQAPLSMEFSRQEYWKGLPFPSPGELSHPNLGLQH